MWRRWLVRSQTPYRRVPRYSKNAQRAEERKVLKQDKKCIEEKDRYS